MAQWNRKKSMLVLFMAMVVMMVGCSTKDNSTTEPSAEGSKDTGTSRIEQIKANGKLVIATSNYYPFEYLDPKTQKLVGYDIDLGQAIADKIGVPVEWKEMQFTALIPSIQNGQVDIGIAAMYITDERKAAVDMSDAYLATGMSLVKRSDDTSINSIDDLDGKVVGVKAGATSEKAANALIEKGVKLEVKAYKDTTDYLSDLKLGRVDVAFNDYMNQMGYNKQYPEANLTIVGEPFEKAGLGLAVTKGDTELLDLANEVIKELESNGEADKLYEKWLK